MSQKVVPSRNVFFAHDTHFHEAAQLCRSLSDIVHRHGYELLTFEHELSLGESFFGKMYEQIERSAFIIADIGCSEIPHATCVTNANVANEIGIASALNKDVIPIVRKGNESKVASNLRMKDFVYYPDCLIVGSSELKKLEKTMDDITSRLVVAEPVRIFHSSGPDYYDMLRRIDNLPGDVHYTGTTLRAFFRPETLDQRWLREVRGIKDDKRIVAELELRRLRRNDWRGQLQKYKCIDVYQKDMLEADIKTPVWRNMTLKAEEMLAFTENAANHLEDYDNYEIHVVKEKLNFKFWIKLCLPKPIVVLESINWESFPRPIIGGIILAADGVPQEFEKEFSRLLSSEGLHNKTQVLDWFRNISKDLIR